MSAIASDDLFLVRRANTLYKVYAYQVRNGSPGDMYVVERAGTLYHVTLSELEAKLQDTDNMMVWDTSAGALCKVTGLDAKAKLFPAS